MLLGDRVPIELRVFLTAAVMIDDIVAIMVIALFYTGEIYAGYLIAGGVVTALLAVLNRAGVYGALPRWITVVACAKSAFRFAGGRARITPASVACNPSEPTWRALDAIHARIESPADKLLRSVEPWSSYVVLPIFALANAGVAWSLGVFEGQGRLICAITLGLFLGKPIGIVLAAWLAVRAGAAVKPEAYSWRQLCGAGALGGIGFTMSLFIAGVAFPDRADYAAAKIAIFLASLIAGGLGVLVLWPRPEANDERGFASPSEVRQVSRQSGQNKAGGP